MIVFWFLYISTTKTMLAKQWEKNNKKYENNKKQEHLVILEKRVHATLKLIIIIPVSSINFFGCVTKD